MNLFTGLMFLEGYIATPLALDAVVPEWRRKPWRESWEEAALRAPAPETLLATPGDACACG